MADSTISALTAATTPVAGTEVLPIVQSSTTKKLAISDLTPGLSTITVAKGGTNLTSYTAGDLLYASGTTALSKLAIGSANQILQSTGSAPQWTADPTLSLVTSTSRYRITGNGSSPGAAEIAFGTNGAGSRAQYNVPTGGEHNFSTNGTIHGLITTSVIGPGNDNTISAGLSFWRYSVVYAATALINTSDARLKQQVANLSDIERAVAKRLKGLIRTFKFTDAVEAKGDGARIHVGVMAQEVASAFEDEGLDPYKYAMFCFDSWDDKFEDVYEEQQVKQADETVKTVSVKTGQRKVLEAGDRFGIRYDQLLAFVISAM